MNLEKLTIANDLSEQISKTQLALNVIHESIGDVGINADPDEEILLTVYAEDDESADLELDKRQLALVANVLEDDLRKMEEAFAQL